MPPKTVSITPAETRPETSLFYIQDFDGLQGDTSRLALRGIVSDLLRQSGHDVPSDFTDLKRRPETPSLHISLSHGGLAACIGWTRKPAKIGVDVETRDRLSEAVIERVSSAEERQGAPDTTLLWSAKEAVFKVHSDAVKVIGAVEIIDWRDLETGVWAFRARLTQAKAALSGSGEIRLIAGHTVAFFLAGH